MLINNTVWALQLLISTACFKKHHYTGKHMENLCSHLTLSKTAKILYIQKVQGCTAVPVVVTFKARKKKRDQVPLLLVIYLHCTYTCKETRAHTCHVSITSEEIILTFLHPKMKDSHFGDLIFVLKKEASPDNVTVQTDLCPHNMSNTWYTRPVVLRKN